MDKRAVDYQKEYFPGCTVEHITDMTLLEHKKTSRPGTLGLGIVTATKRQALYRARKKEAALAIKNGTKI